MLRLRLSGHASEDGADVKAIWGLTVEVER